MELTASINSYKMQSISIKRQNISSQYNSIKKVNNGNHFGQNKVKHTNSSYNLNISFEGRMAQIEKNIYDKIEKKVSETSEAKVNSTQNSDKTKNSDKTEKTESFEEFYSPDKVSKRISDFARSLFPMWLEQNKKEGQADEQAIKKFMEQVNKGVEEGFTDAKKILKGAGKFNDEKTKSVFNKTYKATKKRLKDLSSVLLDDAKYINKYLESQKNEKKEVVEPQKNLNKAV